MAEKETPPNPFQEPIPDDKYLLSLGRFIWSFNSLETYLDWTIAKLLYFDVREESAKDYDTSLILGSAIPYGKKSETINWLLREFLSEELSIKYFKDFNDDLIDLGRYRNEVMHADHYQRPDGEIALFKVQQSRKHPSIIPKLHDRDELERQRTKAIKLRSNLIIFFGPGELFTDKRN